MSLDTFLTVRFKSKTGITFDVKYRLFKNPFVDKWKAYFSKFLNETPFPFTHAKFYGGFFYDEVEIRNDLIDVVDKINRYKKNWIRLKPHAHMDQAFLSALHDDFERLDNLLNIDQFKWPQMRDWPMTVYLFLKRVVLFLCLKIPWGEYVVPVEIARAVSHLNVLIHRYESLRSNEWGHVDLLTHPITRQDFEEADYQYFTPNVVFGNLVITYGVTGVPVLEGFENQITTFPVPQSNFTTGLRLVFHETSVYKKREQLGDWLKKKFNWDVNDPKMAIGYIQLGKIETLLPKEELFEQMKNHQDVEKMFLTSEDPEMKDMIPAVWQDTSDISYHLKFKPYVQLPIEFDHQACYQEASALLEKFVEHRNYDQSSTRGTKWKSLGINALNGDHTKTLNYTQYTDAEPSYSLTEIAERCPKTIEFLKKITDLNQCQRIRFMLLEPGAKISPHSDSPTKNATDTTLAINIALNMPEGCDFWSNLNKDGSHNPYTCKLPMKDGTVFLFNNSPYHSVINNSAIDRIHLIIHGPLRIDNDFVLKVAQEQNKIHSRKELLNRVMKKFSLLGHEIEPSHPIYIDWLAVGHDCKITETEVALAIVEDEVTDQNLLQEATHQITLASLFPDSPPIIKMKALSAWLQAKHDSGAEFAALIGAGTYFLSANRFIVELLKSTSSLKKTDALLAGHLIHHANELPYLHEQFILLNLKKWVALGSPNFDAPYTNIDFTFPEHARSKANVHDDYTPLNMSSANIDLEQSKISLSLSGRAGWGTRLLAKAMTEKMTVINIPQGLRDVKKFSYPRAGRDWQYLEIKKDINRFLAGQTETIYVVNNEPLNVHVPAGFEPDQLIAVSAGLKPASLVHQFWKNKEPKQIHIIDFSKPALEYMTELVHCNHEHEAKYIMKKWFSKTKPDDISYNLAENSFSQILHSSFEGNFAYMLEAFKKLRKATFTHVDMISDPSQIWSKLRPGLKTYFWHSNAFTSNASLFLKTNQQLRETYNQLSLGASNQMQQAAYVHQSQESYEAILKDNSEITCLFSTGYSHHPFNEKDFLRLEKSDLPIDYL